MKNRQDWDPNEQETTLPTATQRLPRGQSKVSMKMLQKELALKLWVNIQVC